MVRVRKGLEGFVDHIFAKLRKSVVFENKLTAGLGHLR